MNITVLGANGKTGVEVVEQALAAGHTVHAVVHHEGSLKSGANLHVVVGDATDANAIAQASKSSNAIISTLGTTSNSSHLMTNATKAVIAASQTTSCKRYIVMSAFTVKRERLSIMTKLASGVVMKGMINDKSESEALVRNSDLNWTIVYPVRLTNQPKGKGVRLVPETEKLGMKQKVARAEVASFMLEIAVQNTHLKEAVTIAEY